MILKWTIIFCFFFFFCFVEKSNSIFFRHIVFMNIIQIKKVTATLLYCVELQPNKLRRCLSLPCIGDLAQVDDTVIQSTRKLHMLEPCAVQLQTTANADHELVLAERKSKHLHDQQSPHEMDWSSLRVIDRAYQHRERKVREAFHIYQRKPQINQDTGIERSAVWNAVL